MKTGLVSLFASVAFLAFAASSASAAEPPTVTIDPTVTTGYTTAEVSGEVDPKGEEVNVYAEYRMAGTDGAWREYFVQTIAAGVGPTVVEAEITGLEPSTEYEFRLNAEVRGSGETYSPEPNPTFVPLPAPNFLASPTHTTPLGTGPLAGRGPGTIWVSVPVVRGAQSERSCREGPWFARRWRSLREDGARYEPLERSGPHSARGCNRIGRCRRMPE